MLSPHWSLPLPPLTSLYIYRDLIPPQVEIHLRRQESGALGDDDERECATCHAFRDPFPISISALLFLFLTGKEKEK